MTPPAAGRGRGWTQSLALVAALCPAWAILGYTTPEIESPTDREGFFLPAAENVLAGRPLDLYSVRAPDGYPNANGPAGIYALAAAAAITHAVHAFDARRARAAWMGAILALLTVFLTSEAVKAVDRCRPELLSTPVRRGLAVVLFGLSPPLWVTIIYFGHDELPLVIGLALAATRFLATGHPRRAGLALGGAMLTKTTSAVYVAVFLVVLAVRRRWGDATRLALTAGAVSIAGFAPFFASDFKDTWFSLIAFRAKAHVLGGTFWGLFPSLEPIATRLDGLVVLAGAATAVALIARRRPGLSMSVPDVYGLLTLAALCSAVFIRSLWGYFWIEPFVFGAVWVLSTAETATPRGRLSIATPFLMLVACLVTLEANMSTSLGPMTRLRTLGVTAATLSAVIPVLYILWWGGPAIRATPPAAQG